MNNLQDQLIRDEGEKLYLYKDSRGILTIGVGHNLESSPITKEASRLILTDDIKRISSELEEKFPSLNKLDEVRKAVLLNMAFNMGVGSFESGHGLLSFSHFLFYVTQGQWANAASEMISSVWATQVGDRAKRLYTQLITGEWQ